MIVPCSCTLPQLRRLEQRLERLGAEVGLEDEDGFGRGQEDLMAIEAERLGVERRAFGEQLPDGAVRVFLQRSTTAMRRRLSLSS